MRPTISTLCVVCWEETSSGGVYIFTRLLNVIESRDAHSTHTHTHTHSLTATQAECPPQHTHTHSHSLTARVPTTALQSSSYILCPHTHSHKLLTHSHIHSLIHSLKFTFRAEAAIHVVLFTQ